MLMELVEVDGMKVSKPALGHPTGIILE